MAKDVLDRLFGELATTQLPVPSTAGVIARGRQRRRRGRGAAILAVLAAAALAGTAASQLAGLGAVRRGPAGVRPDRAVGICQAAPDPSLATALQRKLPIGDQVLAVSPDGSAAYAVVSTAAFRGIAAESVATGAVLRDIAGLPASGEPTAGALGGNGDLIWFTGNTTPSGAAAAGTPMRLWSPSTGAVTTLEPPGQRGIALSFPVLAEPAGTLAAWVQADGSQRAIVEANLRTGAAAVIATGYVGPPLFVGGTLVWSVADTASGRPTRLAARIAAAFPARQQTAVPRVLRGVSPALLDGGWASSLAWPGQTAVSLIASYDGATAYFAANLTELFYSPAPSRPARLVFRLSGDSFSPNSLSLGAGYLAWGTDSAASYVASTSSLAMVATTNGTTDYGSAQGAGDYVVATSTRTPKRGAPAVAMVSGSVVAGLRCQVTGRASG